MVLRWIVAASMMLPAVAGCQSAGTERPSIGAGVPGEAVHFPPERPAEEAAGPQAVLVSYTAPESIPVPAGNDAKASESLSLADLEAIAFQNHPALITAAARAESAVGRQIQAGLYPNPVIGYQGAEMGTQGTAGQQGGFISQRFITGGKLGLDQAIAGKEVDEARFRLLAQEQRVLSDVRVRFYAALATQRRVELANELRQIGDRLVGATEKLLEGRLGTENDLLQAQIRADEAHILYDNAQNEHVEAWRQLAAVIGRPRMELAPLEGQLEAERPNWAWEECYRRVLDGHPQLQAARARVERANFAIQRARQEPIPNVDLMVSVRHHHVTDDELVNVQAGIPIPVFNRNQGNILSAEADWMAASKEVERIELDLQSRLATAYRRHANARQQVERYSQRIVPRARQSLELVANGYDQGQVQYLTLLNAQQTYIQVSLSYLESLRELWASAALIESQLLSGSLMAM